MDGYYIILNVTVYYRDLLITIHNKQCKNVTARLCRSQINESHSDASKVGWERRHFFTTW